MKSYIQKTTVFLLFVPNIKIQEKCHIYHFVEQVKLYRLVYDSICTVEKSEEKNFQNEFDVTPNIGKI
jgi:hypothetical protein